MTVYPIIIMTTRTLPVPSQGATRRLVMHFTWLSTLQKKVHFAEGSSSCSPTTCITWQVTPHCSPLIPGHTTVYWSACCHYRQDPRSSRPRSTVQHILNSCCQFHECHLGTPACPRAIGIVSDVPQPACA